MKQGKTIRLRVAPSFFGAKTKSLMFGIATPITKAQVGMVRKIIRDAEPLGSVFADRGGRALGPNVAGRAQSFNANLSGQDRLSGSELSRLLKFLLGEG